MKRYFLLALLIGAITGCSSKAYQTILDGESLDGLKKITDFDRPSFYPNGGDFGDNLIFISQEKDGSYNIYMKERVFGNPIIQKTSGQNVNLAPNYCSANNRIAFQYFDKTNYDIYYIEAGKGKAITQMTYTPENEFNPSWSPDGNILVFEQGFSPKTYVLPTPKASKIVYKGAVVAKNQIWLKDLKSKELKKIGTGSFPKVSPDGKSIAFIKYTFDKSKSDEIGTLWTMATDGESQKQITNAKLGYATNPNWSPDGKSLVFQLSKRNKVDSDIYVVDTNGENLKQITTNKSNDFDPYWTTDDYVYFTSDRGDKKNNFQIWRFKIKSSK